VKSPNPPQQRELAAKSVAISVAIQGQLRSSRVIDYFCKSMISQLWGRIGPYDSWIVVPVAVGSNPTTHPTRNYLELRNLRTLFFPCTSGVPFATESRCQLRTTSASSCSCRAHT
jgi:hypothetical protein